MDFMYLSIFCTTTPSRSFSWVLFSAFAASHRASWQVTQLTLCVTPVLCGISVMSVWHSWQARLPCTLFPNLSLITCRSRACPSGPGAEHPLFPWQARQVSLSGFPTSFSAALAPALSAAQACPGQTTDAPARQMTPAIIHVASFETAMTFDSPVE